MDLLFTILCAVIVIGFLVFIHEGGHYLAARAFGVRVTEFMLGLPGPNIGFTKGDTKFGVTAVPLGGYARVCGMEAGEMQPHLKEVLAALYRRGTAEMEDIAADCGITDDEAYEALEELTEWGSCSGPTKRDPYNTYRAREVTPSKRQVRAALAAGEEAPAAYALGEARPVDDAQALFDAEYRQQYRSLPFWKRSVILVAGVAVNLLFAIVAFVVLFSVIGFDVQNTQTGEVLHYNATPWQSIEVGFSYIGMVIQAVAGLFNPATVAQTVSDSTSIVGIAVLSKQAVEQGLFMALQFMAMISVSLCIMNLIPITPLDGGRFVVEVFQKATRKVVSPKAMGYLSMAGMALSLGFFAIMLNQDIQNLIAGTGVFGPSAGA